MVLGPHLSPRDMKESKSDLSSCPHGIYTLCVEEMDIEQDAHDDVITVMTKAKMETNRLV